MARAVAWVMTVLDHCLHGACSVGMRFIGWNTRLLFLFALRFALCRIDVPVGDAGGAVEDFAEAGFDVLGERESKVNALLPSWLSGTRLKPAVSSPSPTERRIP